MKTGFKNDQKFRLFIDNIQGILHDFVLFIMTVIYNIIFTNF